MSQSSNNDRGAIEIVLRGDTDKYTDRRSATFKDAASAAEWYERNKTIKKKKKRTKSVDGGAKPKPFKGLKQLRNKKDNKEISSNVEN